MMIKCDEPKCDNDAVGHCEHCDKNWCLEHCLDENGQSHCPKCGKQLAPLDSPGLPNPDCFG